MGRSLPQRLILTFALVSPFGFSSGCGKAGDDMADVPRLRAPEAVPPEKQPPGHRPPPGSSAGMTYDPASTAPR
jgi:hypothetical protein